VTDVSTTWAEVIFRVKWIVFVSHLTLKMTSAQVVETSVTNNSSFQNYTHPDDHTIRTRFHCVSSEYLLIHQDEWILHWWTSLISKPVCLAFYWFMLAISRNRVQSQSLLLCLSPDYQEPSSCDCVRVLLVRHCSWICSDVRLSLLLPNAALPVWCFWL